MGDTILVVDDDREIVGAIAAARQISPELPYKIQKDICFSSRFFHILGL